MTLNEYVYRYVVKNIKPKKKQIKKLEFIYFLNFMIFNCRILLYLVV